MSKIDHSSAIAPTDPTMWTKSEARPIIAIIDAIAHRYGGSARLVGSVERLGCSRKDLDVLLNVGSWFTAMPIVLAVIDGLRDQGYLFGAEGCDRLTDDGHPNPRYGRLGFVDTRGRPIELFLSPPREAWKHVNAVAYTVQLCPASLAAALDSRVDCLSTN